jgi:uncharacterized membrane protein YphA (DoxX/SURF4 family)
MREFDKERNVGRDWPLWRGLLFRFAFCFWILWMLPIRAHDSLLELFGEPPAWLENGLSWPMATCARIVASKVFHLQPERMHWFTGDSPLGWIAFLCILTVALFATALWSGLSEWRGTPKSYNSALAWLLLFLRFTLAFTLLRYGFSKIYPNQFPPLDLAGLTATYGDSTPQEVLWRFMGASRLYAGFGGVLEVVAGTLLMFRRTSTLGAMLAAALMLNVSLLDISYGVPVKLYAMQLCALSLFLLLPDMLPLWRMMVLREPAQLKGVWIAPSQRKSLRVTGHILQIFVLLAALLTTAGKAREEFRASSPKTSIRGVWQIEASKPLQPTGWTRIVIEDASAMFIDTSSGKKLWIPVRIDDRTKTILPEVTDGGSLAWSLTGAEMTLRGTWNKELVELTAKKIDPSEFRLTTRRPALVEPQ